MKLLGYFIGFILFNELMYVVSSFSPILSWTIYIVVIIGIWYIREKRMSDSQKTQTFFHNESGYKRNNDNRVDRDNVIDVEFKETVVK